ncbi:MAG: hypothetical protein PWP56_2664 [Acetobacterium sp.]|jgi:Uroporphyrinogen decarboxylase (URO-D).|uniref:uroporphyrinogen decarboxylase family protein n=2 Tax=unclassified Acetobacterium TaxID=2638182 RepID=UPI000DBEB539|nr:uroporphyrinogen decarboxylase family protein [Acetobacterium sp. K1/6]AWW25896.1 uroporphyrinogen decarboxylase [Acetobacterium sp. KB-1]MDK2943151.1 hypothetical protein [Acetobacterium sp.]MDZ5726789.1 uroporphyrinogen decarboxylase family protein [Acetobacterium sp. K1/6]
MELSQETQKKNQLFENLYDGKMPERVPVFVNADNAFCLEYAGFGLLSEQYSMEKNIEAFNKATEDFNSDVCFGAMIRIPHLYKILGARNFVPGSDGFIQHPEIETLREDEYDEFIADPYKTIWEKVMPRLYSEIEKGGFVSHKAVTKAFFTFYATMSQMGSACAEISNKHGKSTYTTASTSCAVPYDMLSDHLRSFSECSKDIRRRPEKVMAACEAILPMAVKASILPNSNRYNRTFNPLHMGPYMREKDFQRFYWPTFKAYVEALDEAGVGVNIFMEQDWTRYLDYLNELPKGCLMFFEYGDPKVIKEKVGKRHIISGLYPMSILKTETEQVCIDKAKEIMDILAPGGNYMFGFDKGILRLKDVNVNNLKAVLNFAQEYGKY